MTEAFAKKIINLGIKIIGMDTPNPDRSPFSIHKMLFKHEILIIENLTNLESLQNLNQFEIIALPLRLECNSAPAGVLAKF